MRLGFHWLLVCAHIELCFRVSIWTFKTIKRSNIFTKNRVVPPGNPTKLKSNFIGGQAERKQRIRNQHPSAILQIDHCNTGSGTPCPCSMTSVHQIHLTYLMCQGQHRLQKWLVTYGCKTLPAPMLTLTHGVNKTLPQLTKNIAHSLCVSICMRPIAQSAQPRETS